MTPDPLSDERLNAWIDGELGADDAADLLERLRHDGVLRERVAALRLTRDLLRHAYAEGPAAPPWSAAARPSPTRAPRARAWAAGLALLGLGAGLGWLAHGPAGDGAAARLAGTALSGPGAVDADRPHRDATRIVLHLSTGTASQGRAVLDQAEGLLEAARAASRPVRVEIVANGGGLDLLRAGASTQAPRIEALRRAYPELALVACGQTVQRLRESGVEVHLLPGTQTATSALDQIVQRLQQGWTYVRI